MDESLMDEDIQPELVNAQSSAPGLLCSRLMAPEAPGAVMSAYEGEDWHCGKDATWHIFWSEDLRNGLACDKHMKEIRSKWVFYAAHVYNPVCSFEGALYAHELDRCFYPDELEEWLLEREGEQE